MWLSLVEMKLKEDAIDNDTVTPWQTSKITRMTTSWRLMASLSSTCSHVPLHASLLLPDAEVQFHLSDHMLYLLNTIPFS